MMSELIDRITLDRVLILIFGMALGLALGYLVDWHARRKGKPVRRQSPLNIFAAIVILLTMVWIMVSTQQARNCAINLNTSLQVEITAGKMEREAFQNAIAAQQLLPKDVQDLPQTDPAKKAAMKPIEDAYFDQVAKAKKLRADNAGKQAEARRACGSAG